MSLLRRRLMADIPKTEPKGNVVKVVLQVTEDNSGSAPIFDVDFDISQVKYIHLVDYDRELDVDYTLDLTPGNYAIEIGLNELTNGDCMFNSINLQSLDFSDVDISKMHSGRYMFAYTNIDKPPFLSLPNVTLTPNCFEGMFIGCASLIYAPILPSKNLIDGCYKNMFSGCTSLIFIKALFESNPNDYPTAIEDWTLNVASEGTFVMSKDASFSESKFRGVSGIPEGWSVVSSDELVNGKVVNNLSFYYGEKLFVGYPTRLDAQFPVTSEIGSVYHTVDGEDEYITDARTISFGESSSSMKYFYKIPFEDIVYGPKEDDCFIYELPDASDDKELILISVELKNYDSNYRTVYAEKGMTWGAFADSRYTKVSPFYSDGVYIRYSTGEYLYHGDYEMVTIEDLIDTKEYYFVEMEE